MALASATVDNAGSRASGEMLPALARSALCLITMSTAENGSGGIGGGNEIGSGRNHAIKC
jgi:hypothetical protein